MYCNDVTKTSLEQTASRKTSSVDSAVRANQTQEIQVVRLKYKQDRFQSGLEFEAQEDCYLSTDLRKTSEKSLFFSFKKLNTVGVQIPNI